jgi:hypothetical protein
MASASRGSIIVLFILKRIFFTCFITLFLKRDFNTNEHAVAERVTMKETHIILLDDRKLYSTREDTVVFQSSLHAKEIIPGVGAEDGADTQSQPGVLEASDALLIEQSAVPIVVFPENFTAYPATDRVSMPAVANLTEELHGIAILELPFITGSDIQRGVKKKS